MIDDPVTGLAVVLGLGALCQVAASRLRVPGIVLLLLAGLTVGPWLGVLDPDHLYGDLLFPAVSAGVGILLFEGGLSLRWRDLDGERLVILRLLTVGVIVSGTLGALAAYLLGGLDAGPAVLFGAIMVVTGPTVIIPLLRQGRLQPRLARVLRWEGIFVDPVGATIAVVVLEVVVDQGGGPNDAARAIATTVGVGAIVGIAAGLVLLQALRRGLIPDHLQSAVTLTVVIGALAGADAMYHEAGLVATTLLGVILANQRRVSVRHIADFHESIAVILVPMMFILLAARVTGPDLTRSLLPAVGVVAALVVVVRPASVWVSTIGSSLISRERAFIAGMAPRGIVAASVSALFGLRLEERGVAGGVDLAALTFLVIVGTVVVYGVAAAPMARRLRVNAPKPSGVVLVGAPPWAAQLGEALTDSGVNVLVIPCDPDDHEEATDHGLLTYTSRLQSDDLEVAVNAIGARLALVVSPREEVAAFAADRLGRLLGHGNVHVVAAAQSDLDARVAEPGEHWGHLAFSGRLTVEDAEERARRGQLCHLVTGSEADSDADQCPLFNVDLDGVPTVLGGGPAPGGGTLVSFGPRPRTRPVAPRWASRSGGIRPLRPLRPLRAERKTRR